ncbi:MAG: SRPBCC family protein, partial [Thermomicrobiales bacterium]
MPVKIDESGRRSVQAEVEVPGTPEQVWDAIATGRGISSWFVPSEVEERVGGGAVTHFGPGMDSNATITAWEPLHRYAADTQEDLGPNDPTVATEWIVEARTGGTCVVRVVHRWFASSDDWDEQFEGHSYGWLAFFRVLRLYLTHFPGQPCAAFQLMGVAPEPVSDAWAALMRPLGLADATIGQRVIIPTGAPPFAGLVESVGQSEWPELLLRLDEPAPGIAHFVPVPMGGQVFLTLRFYLYGDQASAAVEHAEPLWQAWM